MVLRAATDPYTAVSISSVSATLTIVARGGTSTLSCNAEDKDCRDGTIIDDGLNHAWTGPGSFAIQGNPTVWTASCPAGSQTLHVKVTDAATIADDTGAAGEKDGSVTVTVVGVAQLQCESVTSTTASPGAGETLTVPLGYGSGSVTITATPDPSGAWPGGKPTWTGVSSSAGDTATRSTTAAGEYMVTACCGSSAVAMIIKVVEVEEIQYKFGLFGSWVTVPDPLYVAKGASVDFRAIKNPSSAYWPSGKPVWGGAASGSGTETTTVTFGTLSTSDSNRFEVSAECGNSPPVKAYVVVVGVSDIQIQVGQSWHSVSGTPNKVLLKGARYSFRATRAPSDAAQWPAGWPVWSGLSGDDDTDSTAVAFSSGGDNQGLTASCGSSTVEAKLDVIVPTVIRMSMSGSDTNGHDMVNADGSDTHEYWSSPGGDKVGCFTQGIRTQVKVEFDHAKHLSYTTNVEIASNVELWNEDMTGGDYETTAVSFGTTWASAHPVNSESTAIGQVDYATDVDMDWKYRVPTGTNAWIGAGSVGGVKYCLVWDSPVAPQATPWYEVVQKAVDWADGKSSAAAATDAVMKAVYSDVGGAYDVGGIPNYCGSPEGTTGTFHLSAFLAAIPSVGNVNCYDCGKSLTVFANALGCGLSYRYTYPFGYLNCVKPIGKGWTNNPFYGLGAPVAPYPIMGEDDTMADGRYGFGNHAFAGIGASIYDACMKADTDSSPDAPPYTESWLSGMAQATYLTTVIDNYPASSPGTPTSSSFNVD